MDVNRRMPVPGGGYYDDDDDDESAGEEDAAAAFDADDDEDAPDPASPAFRLRTRRFAASPTPTGARRPAAASRRSLPSPSRPPRTPARAAPRSWTGWAAAWLSAPWGRQRGRPAARRGAAAATAAAAGGAHGGGPRRDMQKKWVLSVWCPPQAGVNLFCWFSPAAVAVIHGMTRDNWLYNIFLAVLVDLLVYFVMQVHADRLRDQEILHAQLAREYNKSFVYTLPPFRRTRAVAVGGDDPWVGDGGEEAVDEQEGDAGDEGEDSA
ncbi:hypothetical protein HK405_000757 [Cladochytrium tenue]|nr:hypothetical protein HK405_000757 [Cladochytrium tenue]